MNTRRWIVVALVLAAATLSCTPVGVVYNVTPTPTPTPKPWSPDFTGEGEVTAENFVFSAANFGEGRITIKLIQSTVPYYNTTSDEIEDVTAYRIEIPDERGNWYGSIVYNTVTQSASLEWKTFFGSEDFSEVYVGKWSYLGDFRLVEEIDTTNYTMTIKGRREGSFYYFIFMLPYPPYTRAEVRLFEGNRIEVKLY
ncbi:MAG TPA: hypothetical protein VMW41_03255 [Candidatus Bathyarchaeia archaeon]|nr:hypothetical protein [Candidatus Bathyarchaeia archaeon]